MAAPILSNALEKTVNWRKSADGGPESLTRRHFRPHKRGMNHVTGLDRNISISVCIR
jgi:hypothetical protein